MQNTFYISREDAQSLLDELMVCFGSGHKYISVYSYGSQADGTNHIDVKILSAILKRHEDSALEQFMLTMSWNRPDLADNEIFRNGKVKLIFIALVV